MKGGAARITRHPLLRSQLKSDLTDSRSIGAWRQLHVICAGLLSLYKYPSVVHGRFSLTNALCQLSSRGTKRLSGHIASPQRSSRLSLGLARLAPVPIA